ncbi:hypothetical protein [Maribellus sediminis]|uniref:hypothetical protein n=1 Tax=Maribellus sediminis TaxID=2696285 RepID=UPI00143140B7|nr:hypothetical protein [Maribellus sediminis]
MKLSILSILLLFCTTFLHAKTDTKLVWPREIKSGKYVITLYQPQLESLDQNILSGRMALSVKGQKEELIFGALWFDAKLLTDLDKRTATLIDLQIPMVKFPDVEDESKLEDLKKLVINDLTSVEYVLSLDHIIADLEDAESAQVLSDNLNNDPPKIYYRSSPTVLVFIDGEPVLKKVENSNMQYVQNTPYLIIKNSGTYYIKGGNYWYTNKQLVEDNWKTATSVPKDVEKLARQMIEESDEPEVGEKDETIPDIIVSMVPSEIITSDGELQYDAIKGTSLLYVKNSENDIIMDINSQKHFVLLNGRWFSSKTLADGDWVFVAPEDIPEDFSKIPEDASISSVLVSVPGTEEAKEAKYEQQMPQTAVVDRKTATAKVEYDGDPQFKSISGTGVEYAINTASTVLRIKGTYYCVDDGIWFESKSAKGPWSVSDSRPEEVNDIPPSEPVYNVKYVYIYDSTPDVVYVGYTPGYCHSYWYHGVPYYGTGYYYRPWYGYYYYPRPCTFGFGVHYNPYTGWGFSVGVSYGWFTASFYGPGYGYWGPAGYRHGYRHGYHHGYHHGYRNGYMSGYGAGYAHGRHDSRNVYNRRSTGVRSTSSVRRDVPSTGNRKVSARPSNRPNNVYTDRDGNIHRRDNNGNWTQENKRPSTRPDLPNKSAQPSTRPAQRPSTQQPTTRPTQRPSTQQPSARPTQRPSTQPAQRPSTRPQGLENQYNNRNKGTTRYNNYQRNSARPPMNRSRPTGRTRR